MNNPENSEVKSEVSSFVETMEPPLFGEQPVAEIDSEAWDPEPAPVIVKPEVVYQAETVNVQVSPESWDAAPVVELADIAETLEFEEVALEPTQSNADLDTQLAEIVKQVPDKLAFKIGDVAEIAGVKPYVLRYWESEFEALTPQKSAFNQRVYSKRDVETILLIKKLLYEEKFSIAGAKKKLKEVRKAFKVEKQKIQVMERGHEAIDLMREIVAEIVQLKNHFA